MLKYAKAYKKPQDSDDIIMNFYGNQDILEESFSKKIFSK